MWTESVRADLIQGLKVGMLCGLWLCALAILTLIQDPGQSFIEYGLEILPYLWVYPALVTVVLTVVLFNHQGSRLTTAVSGGISSYLIANFLIEIALMIVQWLNADQITFEPASIFGLGTFMKGSMIGILVALTFRIPIHEEPKVKQKSSENNPKRPPKPSWDPRIESLKEDLHATKMDLHQVKVDIWHMSQQR